MSSESWVERASFTVPVNCLSLTVPLIAIAHLTNRRSEISKCMINHFWEGTCGIVGHASILWLQTFYGLISVSNFCWIRWSCDKQLLISSVWRMHSSVCRSKCNIPTAQLTAAPWSRYSSWDSEAQLLQHPTMHHQGDLWPFLAPRLPRRIGLSPTCRIFIMLLYRSMNMTHCTVYCTCIVYTVRNGWKFHLEAWFVSFTQRVSKHYHGIEYFFQAPDTMYTVVHTSRLQHCTIWSPTGATTPNISNFKFPKIALELLQPRFGQWCQF